jgi:hypothetical protein
MNFEQFQERLANDPSFKEGYETYKKLILRFVEHEQLSKSLEYAHSLSKFEKYVKDNEPEKFFDEAIDGDL